MIIYFSGSLRLKEVNTINGNFGLLTSYVEQRKKKQLQINTDKKLFLDSGEYSVSTGKATIDINEYISFIKNHKSIFEVYANLDVIGDVIKTNQNQHHMEQKGLNPLPTFHYGSDYNELKLLIKKYSYIGLGGLVPIAMKKSKIIKHLDNCFSIIRDKCHIHGWGVTSKDILLRYPFYSVDSTSHIKSSAFRWEIYNVGTKMRRRKLRGSDSKILLKKNSIAMIKMTDEITKIWEKRGIVYE